MQRTARDRTQENVAFAIDIVVETPTPIRGSDLGLLGYLDVLTYDFEREGQRISCVLVYAEPRTEDGKYHLVVAAETGHEGIACVDDTARAALLALGVYERSASPRALAQARRWLTFIAYMQYPDGRFANFIRNTAGIRNASGPTSVKGGHAWTMRALWTLARAYRVTGDPAYLERYEACPPLENPDCKVNAVLALAELELYRARPSSTLRSAILDRCTALVDTADLGYFRDAPEQTLVHLWGYHQLHAVAEAARVLDEPRLLDSCRDTVSMLIQPDVSNKMWYAFPTREKDGVCAYCVGPIVQGLASLYRTTHKSGYRRLALDAAAWFYGRNDARTTMYDPTTGRCRDGISQGIASLNYGAESAIEAGLAELERRDLLSRP